MTRTLLALLAVAVANAASALTFTTHFPLVAPVPAELLVSSASDTIVYETLDDTLYRSVDGGATFTRRSAIVGYVAVDPTDPDLLYDATQPVVRRSTDGGITWTSIRNNLPLATPTPTGLLVTPRRTVFLASTCVRDHLGGGVFHSSNFGETWSGPVDSQECVGHVSVDPISEQYWTILQYETYPRPYPYFDSIVASERAPEIRYAIRSEIGTATAAPPQVVATFDGWKSWQALTVDGKPNLLELDRDSGRLFLSTTSGLYWSDDRGTSWTRVPGAPDDVMFMKIGGSQLFIRTRLGTYRAPLATLEPFTPLGSLPLKVPARAHNVAVDPNRSVVYATGDGVWRSVDGGGHWEAIAPTAEWRMAITVDGAGDVYAFGFPPPSDSTLFLWHYSPANGTWEKLTVPIPYGLPQPKLVANPQRRGVLYATASSGLFVSFDGGHSWRNVPGVGTFAGSVKDVAADPNRPDVVYAATSEGLFLSVDGGGIWRLLDRAGTSVIAVAPSRSMTLYRISLSSGMLERSDDGGATWQARLACDPFAILLVDPVDEETLWCQTGGSVLQSVDGGKTWMTAARGGIADWAIDRDGTFMHVVMYTETAASEFDALVHAPRRRPSRK